MSSGESYTIWPERGQPIRPMDPSKVTVTVSREFSRVVASDEHEQKIEEIWKQKKEKQPSVFNGLKFRLHRIVPYETQPSGGDNKKKDIHIELGITDYKSFVGTHLIPLADREELIRRGVELKNDKRACFSQSLGVEVILETRDKLLLFIRRSMNVAVAQGKIDMVGGHAEPVEFMERYITLYCPGTSFKSTLESGSIEEAYQVCEKYQRQKMKGSDDLLVEEVFESAAREIRDEVGIPLEELLPPMIIGAVWNETLSGKPDIVYLVRTKLTSKEVQRIYDAGTHPELYETTGLIWLSRDEVMALKFPSNSHDYNDDHSSSQTPDAKGKSYAVAAEAGLELYQRYIVGGGV